MSISRSSGVPLSILFVHGAYERLASVQEYTYTEKNDGKMKKKIWIFLVFFPKLLQNEYFFML